MSRERVASAILELIADDAEFKAGLGRAEGQARAFQDRIGAVGKSMVTVGGAISGFAVAAGASLLAVAQSAANFGDDLQKAGLRTGVATETLQGLKFAAEQSGSSFEAVTKGLKNLARSSSEANQDVAEYADSFERVGVVAGDVNGELKATDELLLELADAFADLENDAEAAALAQDIFGKAGGDLLPLLKEGREGIEALSEEGLALAVVFSQDLSDAAADYIDAQNELATSVGGLKDAIGVALIPALTDTVDEMTPVIKKMQDWIAEHPKLVLGLGATVAVIAGAGGLLLLLGGLGLAIGALTAPILLVAGAIVGLGGITFATFKWREEIRAFIVDSIPFSHRMDSLEGNIERLTEDAESFPAPVGIMADAVGLLTEEAESFAAPAGIMNDAMKLQAENAEDVTEAVIDALPAIGEWLEKWDFETQLAETEALSGNIRALSSVDLPDLGLVTTNVMSTCSPR